MVADLMWWLVEPGIPMALDAAAPHQSVIWPMSRPWSVTFN